MIGRLWRWLTTTEVALRVSAVLTLIALALMVWSMLDPTVWPVMVAMSVGQGLGTFALVLFLVIVIRDLRRGRKDPD